MAIKQFFSSKLTLKSPFIFLWSSLKKSLFLVGLVVTLLYLFLIFTLSKGQDLSVDLPSQGFIIDMSINGEIVDSAPSKQSALIGLIAKGPEKFDINRLLRTITRISHDSRVKGLLVNWNTKSNLSQQTRLNDAFNKLKQERPELPIYFYSNNIDQGTLLASASADRIAIPPVASTLITGPILQLTYFGEAAKKLGIGFTVFKTGPHKAVFEPYVRSTPSEEVFNEYKQLSGDLTNDIMQRIASNRDKPLEDIRAWFSQSLFTVKSTLEQGIVTDITYIDALMSELKDELNIEGDAINATQYFHSSADLDNPKFAKDSIARLGFINAQGAISHQSTNDGDNSKIYAQSLIQQIEWAKNEDDIKAVVLRISSPGGSAQASELIWNKLNQLAKEKPLIVSMGSVAASGGYYLAAAGHKIVAESTTITGSIGVTAILPEVEGLQEKLGVYVHTITDSDRKSLLSIESKPTELDVKIVTDGIQETYDIFLKRVSDGRPLSYDEVEAIAGGRVYTGATAKKLGLVDELGSTDTAFKIAKSMSGLDPEKYYPVSIAPSQNLSILDCLVQRGLENCVLQNQLSGSIKKLSQFTQLATMVELLQSSSKAPQQLTYLPIDTNL